LFFGFVRPYKGLDILLDAMHKLGEEAVHLTIAGEVWSSTAKLVARVRALGLEERVELIPRYLHDDEVAEVFARADAVVLPYHGGGSSGVVALAYRYGCRPDTTSVRSISSASSAWYWRSPVSASCSSCRFLGCLANGSATARC
jgi:glycosyltransferase involved in cell wall biosynthesis